MLQDATTLAAAGVREASFIVCLPKAASAAAAAAAAEGARGSVAAGAVVVAAAAAGGSGGGVLKSIENVYGGGRSGCGGGGGGYKREHGSLGETMAGVGFPGGKAVGGGGGGRAVGGTSDDLYRALLTALQQERRDIAEEIRSKRGLAGGSFRTRSLHSSTFQLNLSRFGHTSPCPPV